jgi:hypothetical protein
LGGCWQADEQAQIIQAKDDEIHKLHRAVGDYGDELGHLREAGNMV